MTKEEENFIKQEVILYMRKLDDRIEIITNDHVSRIAEAVIMETTRKVLKKILSKIIDEISLYE